LDSQTGAGTAASKLGQPDLGILTLNEMRDNAAMIAGLSPKVPLIADADTGFGGKIRIPVPYSEAVKSIVFTYNRLYYGPSHSDRIYPEWRGCSSLGRPGYKQALWPLA
jgi:hypothetical protein